VGTLRGERIVVRDGLGRDAGGRERRYRDETRAVAASHAVEEHAAGRRPFDRVEHMLDPVGEALDEGTVIERGPELRAVHPVDPEVGVLVETVERDVDRLDTAGVIDSLVLVAEVDDRPHAVCAEGLPSGGSQAIDRLGAN